MAEGKQTNHWLILILLALAQFMVVLDISIVNVMLPAVQHEFEMSPTSLQWVVTAYALTFGGFLLFGGRAADLFGRRKVFLTGTLVFTFASLADGLAQSGEMLVIFRGLQGLAAALMSPAALSIVLVTYREGHERNVALSVWGAVAAGGAAVGVLLGGILTQYLTWRWNFFVNVPVGIGVIAASLSVLDRHDSKLEHNDLDLPGAVLVTGGLMLMVYALVEAPSRGWGSTTSIALFAASLLALAAFIYNEKKVRNPLVPLGIFRIRNLSGANALQFCMASAMFSVFFFTTLYLQTVLGFSPIETGLSFLVFPVIVAITATRIPRVVQRIGYRPILIVAPLILASGLFYLSRISVGGNFWVDVAPGLVLMALGMGATYVSVTIAATSGVPPHLSGLASGILTTSQQIGGALGLAVLTGVATSVTTRYIDDLNLTAAPSAGDVAAATVQGFHDGYLIATGFAILASIIAVTVIRAQKPAPVPASAAPSTPPL